MAVATDILNAVKTALEGAFAGAPVYESKRKATDGRNKEAGWQAGWQVPCFVVSCGDPEEIDRRGSFARISVGYPVTIEYVKQANAAITAPANGGAPGVVEDPAIRDVRATLRATLYFPKLAGVSSVYDVRHDTLKPYEKTADGGGVLVVSGERFTWTASETRASSAGN